MQSLRSEVLLSDLPDDIIVEIVSRHLASKTFTSKEAIRLGFLSKAIFRKVQNRPSLIFDGSSDVKLQRKRYKQELDYMYKTLRRYYEQDIHLETFTFKFGYCSAYFEDCCKCINLATKWSLKSLNLEGPWCHRSYNYMSLPDIYAIESLVELSLKQWKSLPPKRIAWPNLKRLCLSFVDFERLSFLEDLTRSCPLIESLVIQGCCSGCQNFQFRVFNLRNLKQLIIRPKYTEQTFEVRETPNLESITCSYDELYSYGHPKFPIRNLGQLRYQNLRTLSLNKFRCKGMINGIFFTNFASEFPQLQELSMSTNDDLQRISLSSPSLKKIRLANMELLKEAQFDVPNIVHFKFESYHGIQYYLSIIDNSDKAGILPQLSFIGNPDGWISDITLGTYLPRQWRIECGAKWCWSPTSVVP